MKLIKSILNVLGTSSALASEVEVELECEDKSLAKLLEDQEKIENEAKNHKRRQKSKSHSFCRC